MYPCRNFLGATKKITLPFDTVCTKDWNDKAKGQCLSEVTGPLGYYLKSVSVDYWLRSQLLDVFIISSDFDLAQHFSWGGHGRRTILMDAHPYGHETSIFSLCAPHEEVQGRQKNFT